MIAALYDLLAVLMSSRIVTIEFFWYERVIYVNRRRKIKKDDPIACAFQYYNQYNISRIALPGFDILSSVNRTLIYLLTSTFQVWFDIFFEIIIKVNVMEYTRELVNVVRGAFLLNWKYPTTVCL